MNELDKLEHQYQVTNDKLLECLTHLNDLIKEFRREVKRPLAPINELIVPDDIAQSSVSELFSIIYEKLPRIDLMFNEVWTSYYNLGREFHAYKTESTEIKNNLSAIKYVFGELIEKVNKADN